jgi:hypothetical protein
VKVKARGMDGDTEEGVKSFEGVESKNLEAIVDRNGRVNLGREVFVTPKEAKKGKGRPTNEELRMRERANSTSIMDFVRGDKGMSGDLVRAKRKREEKEQLADAIFKRDNKTVRTPPGSAKTSEGNGEKGTRNEEEADRQGTRTSGDDGAMLVILKEICTELKDMRMELKEMKDKMNNMENSWNMKEKGLEGRMVNFRRQTYEVGTGKGRGGGSEEGSRH